MDAIARRFCYLIGLLLGLAGLVGLVVGMNQWRDWVDHGLGDGPDSYLVVLMLSCLCVVVGLLVVIGVRLGTRRSARG